MFKSVSRVGATTVLLTVSVVFLAVGLGAGYLASSFPSQSRVDALEQELGDVKAQLAESSSKIVEIESSLVKYDYPRKVNLPSEWVVLSDVIPMMGQHVANPGNLPLGPILLLGKDGSLLGVEYMFTLDMLEDKTITTPDGQKEEFKALIGLPVSIPELGITAVVDHIDVAYLEHGHEGFTAPHLDIHLYFVDKTKIAELTT